MTKRQYIPTMRREINELVVMPVYVADDVNGNDFEAVRRTEHHGPTALCSA